EAAFNSFLNQLKNDIRIMPGLRSLLPHIKNYKLAVITEDSRDLTSAKLEALGLTKDFEVVLTSDEIGSMKPDPLYYKKVFSQFKVTPSECLVVGDDYQKDLSIPKKMGATVVCLGECKEADFSIKSYKSLLNILDNI
ncbi:MAG: HAD family hydrolase, partial [Candidatus Omnitrophica bacterium]|nr:HAD family hydrolase [Candidatus Omnitrophota bacterium]